jgi:hypothetical protein
LPVAFRSEDLFEALAELLPLGEELRQRYAQARRAVMPLFRGALGGVGVDAECVGDESLAVVDGIMVDALIDPGRYPPERLLALLRRALERLVLSA